MLPLIDQLIRHKCWANANLLRSVEQHPPAAEDPELRKLLHHILVSNRYCNTADRRVTLRACGTEYTFTIRDDVPGMDTRTQNRSIVANFVHSMDASALALTTHAADLRGIRHFSAVHDSFGTLAADMPVLIDCIRQSFVKMYQENDVLMQLKERMEQMHGVSLPPPPERGQLDIAGVLASHYFFA